MKTPGPWTARLRGDGLVNIYHLDGITEVALCVKRKDTPIVVAAPTMYDVLQSIITHRNEEFLDNASKPYSLAVMVLDAIKTAEGVL